MYPRTFSFNKPDRQYFLFSIDNIIRKNNVENIKQMASCIIFPLFCLLTADVEREREREI